MQPGGVPDDRQIGHLPLNMVPESAGSPAPSADRVQAHRGTEQVRQLAGDRGVGDGHPEFDGAADGVGKQAGGSVQSGSWVVLGAGVGTAILTPPGPPNSSATRYPTEPPLRTPDPEEPINLRKMASAGLGNTHPMSM